MEIGLGDIEGRAVRNSEQPRRVPAQMEDLIYTVRGRQVMLDSDLAALYEVETRVFNQAVSRNVKRFPEEFRFQLTREEFDNLRSQSVISSEWGGRRSLPYAFTEQGVAMLSGVLRSDAAISISIQIMNAFVRMRHFIVGNAGLLQRMDAIEVRQAEYQRLADEKFALVLERLEAKGTQESSQAIFFDGQIYDAFEFLARLVRTAREEIVLVDSYVDLDTLNVLSKKGEGVRARIYTTKRGCRLSKADVNKFNQQYPALELDLTSAFHDRFLLLDSVCGYHIGASIKDAGKKCFGVTPIEDHEIIRSLLRRLRH